MIKVCSLDFLKKEVFEADIKTADGQILFHSGEKVTQSAILRLYFLSIYVDEPLQEEIIETDEVAADVIEEIVEETVVEAEASVAELAEVVNVATDAVVEEAASVVEEAINAVEDIEEELVSAKAVVHAAESVAEEEVKEEAKEVADKPVGPRMVDSATETTEKQKHEKGPRSVESPELKEEAETTKGPRKVLMDDDENGLSEANETAQKKPYGLSQATPEVEEIPIDPGEVLLTFDEDMAKRIVKHSVKLGEMLKFSAKELKELEQVGYYSNYGISRFKRADMSDKNFRKKKAYASYEALKDSGVVSIELADIVKYCANNYESESFPLNSKIPYHHIVAITGYYEEYLEQCGSKQETLLKMLQLGGNHFNIFVLHKFIKMMRDING